MGCGEGVFTGSILYSFLFYLLFCSGEGWKEGEVNGFEAPVRDMMREGGGTYRVQDEACVPHQIIFRTFSVERIKTTWLYTTPARYDISTPQFNPSGFSSHLTFLFHLPSFRRHDRSYV
jgi:hypothetical protein